MGSSTDSWPWTQTTTSSGQVIRYFVFVFVFWWLPTPQPTPKHLETRPPAPAAKLWCDVESAEEAEELSRLYGVTVVPAFTGGWVGGLAGRTETPRSSSQHSAVPEASFASNHSPTHPFHMPLLQPPSCCT